MRLFFEEHIGTDFMDLSKETVKHVAQVLRMQVGDQFAITDGRGTKALVEINQLDKKNCSVRICELESVQNHNATISLAIAFTKNNNRMEWLLEKITEIGIQNIYPLITDRSEKKIIKPERFRKKLISAMIQSQQYYLPKLCEPIAFKDLTNLPFDNKLIAHCEANLERVDLSNTAIKESDSTVVAIGPEGDFTIEEIEWAQQQNFKSITLGKNRLRTETAGLVAITLLNNYAD